MDFSESQCFCCVRAKLYALSYCFRDSSLFHEDVIEEAFSEVANKEPCERGQEPQDNYKCPVCGCYHKHYSLSEW